MKVPEAPKLDPETVESIGRAFREAQQAMEAWAEAMQPKLAELNRQMREAFRPK